MRDGLCTMRYSGGCVNCYNGEMMNISDKDKEASMRVFQSLQSMIMMSSMTHPECINNPSNMVAGVGMFIAWFCSEILQPVGDHKQWIDKYFESLKQSVFDAIDHQKD